jgi:5-methyltetrahydrofolate--homocysteine methyltransferase
MENILEQIAVCVERGKSDAKAHFPPELKGKEGAYELTERALHAGIAPDAVLNEGLIKGMQRIGAKFRENKAFVPDVLISAKAMKTAMKHLEPYFLSNQLTVKGKIILGTVAGDFHDIGKSITGMLLQGGGWEIIDLGVNVSAARFITAAEEHKASAIGLSALLTTTMLNMEEVVKLANVTLPTVKTLVGGAPLSQAFADDIGADCYSPDPQGALDYLQRIAVDES